MRSQYANQIDLSAGIELAQNQEAALNPPLASLPMNPPLPLEQRKREDEIFAARGFSGIVRDPTKLNVAEGGRDEMVSVTPLEGPMAQAMGPPPQMAMMQAFVNLILQGAKGRRKTPYAAAPLGTALG